MDRVEIEHALGLLVVAHHGVVAGEAEDVGDAQEGRRQKVGLQPQAVAVAARGLEDGIAAAANDLAGDRQGAHAHHSALVVGHVEAVDLVLEQVDVVQHGLDVGAFRRADLARDDEAAAVAGVAVGAHYTSLPIFCFVSTPVDDRARMPDDVPVLGLVQHLELVLAPFLLQLVEDERPGAVHLGIHLALAVAGAAAGTVDQALGAAGDGADGTRSRR